MSSWGADAKGYGKGGAASSWGADAKGYGKGGKDKGKNSEGAKGGKGHLLPRTRLSAEKFAGTVDAWKGNYGWIKPAEEIAHEKANQRNGNLYCAWADVQGDQALEVGSPVKFHIFEDEQGLGAEEVEQIGPAPQGQATTKDSGWGASSKSGGSKGGWGASSKDSGAKGSWGASSTEGSGKGGWNSSSKDTGAKAKGSWGASSKEGGGKGGWESSWKDSSAKKDGWESSSKDSGAKGSWGASSWGSKTESSWGAGGWGSSAKGGAKSGGSTKSWTPVNTGFDKTSAKGKGSEQGEKGGKGHKKGQGHKLPRTRITAEKFTGTCAAWKGKYGWITPAEEIKHEKAAKNNGSIFVSMDDLEGVTELTAGAQLAFHIWEDSTGLGAEEVVVVHS